MKKVSLFTRFAKWLACSFLYKVEYKNIEALDKYNSYIIAPTHSNVFDPVFVFPAKYEKDITIAAKKELFKNFLFRIIAKKYNVFSVDRENVDVNSIRKPIEFLKSSDSAKLIIFPEGKVIKDEREIGNVYRKGAAFIAFHVKKPIIPVFISRRPDFFSKVTVAFGEPFFIDSDNFKGKNKFDDATKMIIQKAYELCDTKQYLIGGQQ